MGAADQATDKADLATTSYAVLGLLTFGEMSGYDVMKLAQNSIAYFWAPAKSQVYSELKRLSELGFLSEKAVAQDTRPDKRLYRITRAGRTALKQWLDDPEVQLPPIRDPLLLKVFFAREGSRQALMAQLEEYERRSARQLNELLAIEQQIKDQDEWFFPYLTLRMGVLKTQASIQWAKEASKAVRRREAR